MRKSPFEWIIETLENNDKVESTTIISENLLHIKRTNGTLLSVTKSTLNSYNVASVREILNTQNANFILHIPKSPFISGDALDYLETKKITLGGFGDLTRVIKQENNWPYLPPNVSFILRGLRQHTKVISVNRLDNKRYEIARNGLETVIIIALDDYDLGIEAIRCAVDEFGKFDAVFKANPNGSITSKAIELADSREIKVFTWGELLGKLNLKWTWRQ
ncbi:hypothetical protein [Chitinophaga eiseniae]|uniref:Uncharacterized protein n=1 Tax=Chitinophaga eiseniae TaxID=634771 RepID=A0A847SPS4_9BACT|nr:hypothetical protein [Chitinophaga eiseniae]NLR82284.1 hypothetical protein [Chitinophaga eiseniae]